MATDTSRSPAPNIRGLLESFGEPVRFSLRVLRQVPSAVRLYPSEVFRYAGVLIRGNSAVVLFMVFMFGALFSITLHFMFTKLGIDSYMAGAHTEGSIRGPAEVVFGWMISAKVGCGIVAEIGAMRISDEVDAMEVMGIRSVSYLASTRVAAGMIVLPFLWATSLAVEWVGGYIFNVLLLQTTSPGAFDYILFLFQNPRDFVFALIWATSSALVILLVSCYCGFSAKGGPVGVGRNTAQSMLINLVLISTLAMLLIQLFYGNDPNAPIAN